MILLFIAAAAGYVILGGYTPMLASDTKTIREKTYRFWECIKFKSFDLAAEFDSAEDKDTTAEKIEQLFQVKPENLDIQEIDVLHCTVDSTGILGRTKTRLNGEMLNPNRPATIEVMLFWEKKGPEWELKLRSSLD